MVANRAYIPGARRGTSRPPGNTGSVLEQPLATHSRITRHTVSRRSRTSSAGRTAVSFAHTTSAMDMPCRRQMAISSSQVVNGYGTPVSAGDSPVSDPAASSSDPASDGAVTRSWLPTSRSSALPRWMNPPPIEYHTCSSTVPPSASNASNRIPLGWAAKRRHWSNTTSRP